MRFRLVDADDAREAVAEEEAVVDFPDPVTEVEVVMSVSVVFEVISSWPVVACAALAPNVTTMIVTARTTVMTRTPLSIVLVLHFCPPEADSRPLPPRSQ